MRLPLAIALILLFLWLREAQVSDGTWRGNPCEAASLSKAAVGLVLSPLSFYTWLASTLVRLALSVPAAVLAAVHHSLLLLVVGPWAAAAVCASLLLTCLHVLSYLLHLALVLGAVAILTLTQRKMAAGTWAREAAPREKKPGRGLPTLRKWAVK